jgi:serine/threonine-protein kinase
MNLTGRTLGKYRLLERLGQGGMAQVYKAEQPTIERLVAIKVLHSHLAESDDFVARFKREARGLGQLQHPHIVQVIDFDIEDNLYYMVVDYIPGQTLQTYLDEKKALPYSEALAITAQLADALAYAHSKDTIHRDIKPSNVLFKDAASTQAVLTDFGISRLMNDATLTVTGAIVGTPAYMSPEAVLGQRVDQRADIFSLGTILYEMVTGRTPHTGDTPMSVILKQLNEPLPSPRTMKPDMPEDLVQLIEKALAKDPAERFQTAAEFLAAIQAVRATIADGQPAVAPLRTLALPEEMPTMAPGMPATPAPRPQPTPPPQPAADQAPAAPTPAPAAPTQPNRAFRAIAGVLVLGLAALGLWWGVGRSDQGAVVLAPTTTATSAATATVDPTATAALEPTATTAPAATATPDTLVIEPTTVAEPVSVPAPLGMLRFADSETTRAGNFILHLDRVTQPPAGSQYALWLQAQDGSTRNVGALPLTNGTIFFTDSIDENLVATVDQVLVTIEPAGEASARPAPTGPVAFTGQLPEDYTAELRQILVTGEDGPGMLIGAQEQATIAGQHAQFSLDGLAADDLTEAKHHAEHVVNILDGESGEFFGDVNLDGQTQNPGDGVGVRGYLAESRQRLAAAQTAAFAADDQHLERAQVAIDGSLAGVEAAITSARKIAASDTVAEAQPFGDDMNAQITALVGDPAAPDTITAAYAQVLTLAAIPLLAEQAVLPAPDALADPAAGRVGFFRVTRNATTSGNDFLLQMAPVAPPPADAHFDAWLVHNDRNDPLFLGELTSTSGYAFLQGSQEAELLQEYDRLIISLETTPANLRPSDEIFFEGDFQFDTEREVARLLSPETPSGKGTLFGAEEQTRTAMQHKQFAQDALAAGDLAEAQRHTEHAINILDGEEGTHFGDLNLDGQTQNPGDGVGVRGYLQTTIAVMEQMDARTELSGNQHFYARQIITTSESRLATIEAAIEQALKVFASDNIEEAGPFLAEFDRLLTTLLDGVDTDENGIVDPLTGEGGILMLEDMALALNEVAIVPTNSALPGAGLTRTQPTR